MSEQRKILGEERRQLLLSILKDQGTPVKGGELAERTNVSRQVIVGDISLLKAKNEPIIATSQGYLYMKDKPSEVYERTVACIHSPEETKEELNILVDHGVVIKDVSVEHPVYGDLTATLRISNRKEVEDFVQQVTSKKASYLLELTGGIHMHTITAKNENHLQEAVEALGERGFLADE
ncbi:MULTISPECIES: transcription repressor NadR [Pontibacillus]|uniref:Transcription repressor NadR n=1 Tax=Pontibacillus chungwhensis TaxID=265426 RepID=A0ABY8V068_9BACI|nr:MULTISPECIES: transcription repressor NadR [Pontibacillus]MCD5325743.1 transcription repressor NadR [Pontibacillus sp. HN14]WIF98019.1 transcription repressor NadR [Pontibacillus chungwhensis]